MALALIAVLIIDLALAALMIVSFWKIFEKAGQPGWAAIVPIYNLIVLLRVAGKPWGWIFLMLIPIANLIFAILIGIGVARNFGKSDGFGVGLALLGIIFYPILAFSDAQYNNPQAGVTAGGPLDRGM